MSSIPELNPPACISFINGQASSLADLWYTNPAMGLTGWRCRLGLLETRLGTCSYPFFKLVGHYFNTSKTCHLRETAVPHLVGGFNPSEKYESQLGWLFRIYRKNVWNHQPACEWSKGRVSPEVHGSRQSVALLLVSSGRASRGEWLRLVVKNMYSLWAINISYSRLFLWDEKS